VVEFKELARTDSGILKHVASGLFDRPIDPSLTEEFLEDPRHHLVVAIDGGEVVGFVSAVHYVHPDKPNEMWLNEIGVVPSHRRCGLATKLLGKMLEIGGKLGCVQAWVLTERDNVAAMGLYAANGGQPAPADSVLFTFSTDGRKGNRRS